MKRPLAMALALGGVLVALVVFWTRPPAPTAGPDAGRAGAGSSADAGPRPVTPIPGHAAWITALAVDPKRIYSGDANGVVIVWDVRGRYAMDRWEAHRGGVVRLQPVAGGVVSFSQDGSAAWWKADGERQRQARLPSRYLNDGAVLGDGVLVVADEGHVARLVPGGVTWNHVGHQPDALAAAVSGDGAQVASGGHDGHIRIATAADGAEVRRIEAHAKWITALAWQGETLFSAAYDGRVRAFDAATGERKLDVAAHPRPVLALAVHGDRLLTGSDDFTARVFEVNGTPGPTLRGPELPVQAVALDGSHAYTGSRENVVRVWRLTDGTSVGTLP